MRTPLASLRSYARRQVRRVRRAWKLLDATAPGLEAELVRPWFRGLDVATIIDVGANTGQFAAMARHAFPSARIVSVEPIPECARDLRTRFAGDPKVTVVECALGESNGEVSLHRNDYSPSSSLLGMEERHQSAFPHTARATTIAVSQRRLDDVVGEARVAEPLLLKLDVQGYELHVLRGGSQTLARAKALLVELSLQRLYKAEPLFDESYRFIAAAGFRLAGIADTLRDPRDQRPLQIDAIFERA